MSAMHDSAVHNKILCIIINIPSSSRNLAKTQSIDATEIQINTIRSSAELNFTARAFVYIPNRQLTNVSNDC